MSEHHEECWFPMESCRCGDLTKTERLEGALAGVINAYDSLYDEGEDADFDDRLKYRWERRVDTAISMARRILGEE